MSIESKAPIGASCKTSARGLVQTPTKGTIFWCLNESRMFNSWRAVQYALHAYCSGSLCHLFQAAYNKKKKKYKWVNEALLKNTVLVLQVIQYKKIYI